VSAVIALEKDQPSQWPGFTPPCGSTMPPLNWPTFATACTVQYLRACSGRPSHPSQLRGGTSSCRQGGSFPCRLTQAEIATRADWNDGRPFSGLLEHQQFPWFLQIDDALRRLSGGVVSPGLHDGCPLGNGGAAAVRGFNPVL
jgi:hypothetical protein